MPARPWALVCVLILSVAPVTGAQQPPPPCSSVEHRQFDFWLGEWEVHGPKGLAGTNRIELAHSGCVLRERYSTPRGYAGESLNTYDSGRKVWHQTWVDNSGLVLLLEGGLRDGMMVLEGTSRDARGVVTRHRISWTPNPDGRVRQHWESTNAAGQWTTAFDGMYTKKPATIEAPPAPPGNAPGILLEDLTWPEAERVLTPDTIVVIPIGAAAKEHGPHLRLKNDLVLAEYFKRRLLDRLPVVMAPTMNYHYYPAFVEYPGSTSLRLDTARDVIVDICRSLARFGPRRFYALNTGVSTLRALQPAADVLAAEGLVFRYTDILKVGAEAEAAVRTQEGGTHADEIETSMMLYMDPSLVDMTRAAKDYHPQGTGGLTRDPKGKGTYSPTGIWGDATLATREKGRIVVEAMIEGMVGEVKALAGAPVPQPPTR